MILIDDLLASVDRRFAARSPELALWPDPHGGRAPADEEYSRVTDARRWRVLGARVDAWVGALVEAGVATVEPVAVGAVRWTVDPLTRMSSALRVVPAAPGARPVVVARSQVGDVPETGVTLGWGDPAVVAGLFPDCGCDACDTGSQPELERIDRHLTAIVAGGYRRLTRGEDTIIELAGHGWSATGVRDHWQVGAVLADPRGWQETSGASWLG